MDLFQNNSVKNNKFQQMQHNKYMNGSKDSFAFGNLSSMNKPPKFSNHKYEYKSNGGKNHHKDRHFDKSKKLFSYGNSKPYSNNYYNNYHKSNSNPWIKNNKFKYR